MKIKCYGSSSQGNCYSLETDNETVIIEAGVNPKQVMKGINFNIRKVVGVFISHEHGDHAKYILDWVKLGIKVYASNGTLEALNLEHYNTIDIKQFKHESVKIMGFEVFHDVNEPIGFLISICGKRICFITDTRKIPYTMKKVNLFMVEANYSKELLLKSNKQHAQRVIDNHLAIDETINFLKRSVDKKTEQIMLLHLSDGHSNAQGFKEMTQQALGIPTIIADKNIEMEM